MTDKPQIKVGAKGMQNLYRHAVKAGTVDNWIELAMDWILKAELYFEEVHKEGYNEALREFAYWKDGQQYVGSCGTKLEDALK